MVDDFACAFVHPGFMNCLFRFCLKSSVQFAHRVRRVVNRSGLFWVGFKPKVEKHFG